MAQIYFTEHLPEEYVVPNFYFLHTENDYFVFKHDVDDLRILDSCPIPTEEVVWGERFECMNSTWPFKANAVFGKITSEQAKAIKKKTESKV